MSKIHFEKSRSRFFSCWAPEPPGIIHRPHSKKSSNLFGQHFFLVAFLGFNLPGALRNRFKMILLDQEMNFKKIHRKKIFFSGRKIFSKKKLRKKVVFFSIFEFSEKIIIFEKIKILIFSKMMIFSENSKIEKKTTFFLNFFFENIFRPEKNIFFRWIFLKFISWSRRIILKRFLSAPGRLKPRKATRKKCWPNKFDDFLLCGRCMIPGGSGAQHEKNRERLFSK